MSSGSKLDVCVYKKYLKENSGFRRNIGQILLKEIDPGEERKKRHNLIKCIVGSEIVNMLMTVTK